MAFGIPFLRPEIDTIKYWIHIAILAIIVRFLLNITGIIVNNLFTLTTLYIGLAIAGADIIAHSVLFMD